MVEGCELMIVDVLVFLIVVVGYEIFIDLLILFILAAEWETLTVVLDFLTVLTDLEVSTVVLVLLILRGSWSRMRNFFIFYSISFANLCL